MGAIEHVFVDITIAATERTKMPMSALMWRGAGDTWWSSPIKQVIRDGPRIYKADSMRADRTH